MTPWQTVCLNGRMEATERSPEIHHANDVKVWLTQTDESGEGISHASAQCPGFAEGAKAGLTLTTETDPTGWLCGFCADVTTTTMATHSLPGNIDAPAGGGGASGSGTTAGGGPSDKQVALIERLVAELGVDKPVYHSKAQASAAIDTLLELQRSHKADELVEAAKEAQSPAEVEAWLAGLGRKVEPGDMNKGLQLAATLWAAEWSGDFAFMVDMHDAAVKGMLSAGQAKGVLNCWRADINRKPKAQPKAAGAGATEDGIYQIPGGDVVKVQIAKQGSGNLYAKRLVLDDEGHGEFVYEQGLVRKLQPEWRMTLEQAKAFGKLYGVCCRCSADLTDEHSIAEGIGPICATKGWS